MSEQGEVRGPDWDGMNLVGIEEHQVRDLVFAQIHYLYILLEATLAYVNIPMNSMYSHQGRSQGWANRASEEHSGWYAQKLVRQAGTTVSEKELLLQERN